MTLASIHNQSCDMRLLKKINNESNPSNTYTIIGVFYFYFDTLILDLVSDDVALQGLLQDGPTTFLILQKVIIILLPITFFYKNDNLECFSKARCYKIMFVLSIYHINITKTKRTID